jgi:hypothetical protein
MLMIVIIMRMTFAAIKMNVKQGGDEHYERNKLFDQR